MQQHPRLRNASLSFYEGACSNGDLSASDSNGSKCLLNRRRYQVYKLGFLLLSLILLCGSVVCFGVIVRGLGSWPQIIAQSPSNNQQASATVKTDAADSDRDSLLEDSRQYLTSNLSLLMTGGWSLETRFHPASFRSAVAVLNDTVYCDDVIGRDTRLVYSNPTWICKNVRIGGSSRLPFSDATSSPLEELLISRHQEMHGEYPIVGDSCGRLPDRRNNVLLLCELMLSEEARSTGIAESRQGRLRGMNFRASSVHIPYGNCSFPERKRMILVGMTTSDAEWYTENLVKPGFVTDIFCSFSG